MTNTVTKEMWIERWAAEWRAHGLSGTDDVDSKWADRMAMDIALERWPSFGHLDAAIDCLNYVQKIFPPYPRAEPPVAW